MSIIQDDLKVIKYNGFRMLQSKQSRVSPYFSNMVSRMIRQKRACNIVFTGAAGTGKSYLAINQARMVEGRYLAADGTMKDRFTIDQVVFTFSEFMKLVMKLKMGKIIIFDEPSYSLSKREWFKEANQILCKTIESMRFKIHPLFLCIINKSLLDKSIRDHLIQYQVNVIDRGRAQVYTLSPSQFQDKMFHGTFCEIHTGLLDKDECARTRGGKWLSSCLGCKQIDTCMVFRAQYERKKAAVQEDRYEEAHERAQKVESKQKSIKELERLALTVKDSWLVDDRVHVNKLRTALADIYGIPVSKDRAYRLRTALEVHNKEIFEQ